MGHLKRKGGAKREAREFAQTYDKKRKVRGEARSANLCKKKKVWAEAQKLVKKRMKSEERIAKIKREHKLGKKKNK